MNDKELIKELEQQLAQTQAALMDKESYCVELQARIKKQEEDWSNRTGWLSPCEAKALRNNWEREIGEYKKIRSSFEASEHQNAELKDEAKRLEARITELEHCAAMREGTCAESLKKGIDALADDLEYLAGYDVVKIYAPALCSAAIKLRQAKRLEAECAVMRDALLASQDYLRFHCNKPICWKQIVDALSTNAGKDLLLRMERYRELLQAVLDFSDGDSLNCSVCCGDVGSHKSECPVPEIIEALKGEK